MKFQMFVSSLMFLMFTLVSGQYEKELLLELRNNLTYNSSSSTKLLHWDESSSFCQWPGVKCDSKNRVSALDLSGEPISGGINDANSSLFKLVRLQNLSLADTSFASNEFSPSLPSGFGRLTELRYLNLSNSGFSGQVPSDFSNLTRLVVLDLSNTMYTSLELKNPNLRRLIHNLIELRELYLDGVNISANGIEWGSAISSSLPNLRVLSLRNSSILGPFDSSLLKLKSLSVIRLDDNSFSSPFPHFFADFSNLRELTARYCNLTGVVPAKLFQTKSLQIIDLNSNSDLGGPLPEFPVNIDLSYVDLSGCNFSGPVPTSLKNLTHLVHLDLSWNQFSGPIPTSIKNLTHLVYLDLSSNQFSGSVPSFASLKNLRSLYLHRNRLSGQIPESHWKGLDNLEYISLSHNSLQGEIPGSLFVLPMVKILFLSNNSFSGSITVPAVTSSTLRTLDLSDNSLEGPIPRLLFELQDLFSLVLSRNKFTGSLNLTGFPKMEKLLSLDLSYNDLSIHVDEKVSLSSVFPRLQSLYLASCKLQKIPLLKNQSSLMVLDLSVNQLEGEIPNWIFELGNASLSQLILSYNRFTHIQEPYDLRSLYYLDLRSNALGGQIPLPPNAAYVDFSRNNFTSSLPPNIGDYLKYAVFISLADNNITGTIPSSLCKATRLETLVLSNNSFSGGIPSCLIEKPLSELNLRRNNLNGEIPDTFAVGCPLKTLDLSRNFLRGKVPKSLARCSELEVVNLGNNALNDTFPCWLSTSFGLRVLELRSNKFYGNIDCLGGTITWPNLQIISLAYNNINGVIPANLFPNLQAMVKEQQKLLHRPLNAVYYLYSIEITLKGREIVLEKILTIFTSIDFSANNLHGPIPQTIGEAKSLYYLNISHNALSGQIPSSIGNLKLLESLDLSVNNLDREIPSQLASLTFLSSLNLSYNHLVGRVPHGPQMQTFDERSFAGNSGLCGFALNRTCNNGTTASSAFEHEGEGEVSEREIIVSAALGFLVGLGFIFWPLLCCKRWRRWYDSFVKKTVLLVLRQKNRRRLNDDW